jgi:hypothetical protein
MRTLEDVVLDTTARVSGAIFRAIVLKKIPVAELAAKVGMDEFTFREQLQDMRSMSLRLMSDIAFECGVRFDLKLNPSIPS